MKIHDQITVLDYNRNVTKESSESDVADFNIEFVDQMLEYWDNNITNIFRRQKDILVAGEEKKFAPYGGRSSDGVSPFFNLALCFRA